MADWTNITDTAVEPDAPLTSQLGYAWRDNPIAIAEGASGAPRMAVRTLGDAGTTVSFSGLGIYSGIVAHFISRVKASSNTTFTLKMEASDDGATWYGATTIYTNGNSGSGLDFLINGNVFLDFATGNYGFIVTGMAMGPGPTYTSGTMAGVSLNTTMVRFVVEGTTGSRVAVMLYPNGGNA